MTTIYWCTVRFPSGREVTHTADSAIGRALFIISTSRYATVIAEGEREGA